LLLSDWQGGQVGRRRLIPWSRLVRVNSEKPGITLGVRFVDSSSNHRIAGTVSMRLWLGKMGTRRSRVRSLRLGMTFGWGIRNTSSIVGLTEGLDHFLIIITFIITFRTNTL
jgi:hypothetical protein